MSFLGQQNREVGMRNRHSFGGKGINDDPIGVTTKQFGLGKLKRIRKKKQKIGWRNILFIFLLK